MQCRRKDVSGVNPPDVTVYAVRCFATLGGASVFVIVVGNYCVAAFYEASGASACRIGFHIPVETSAPPNSFPFSNPSKTFFQIRISAFFCKGKYFS